MIDNQIAIGKTRSIVHFLDELVENGKLQKEGSSRILAGQSSSGQPLDVVITELGLMQDVELATALSSYFDRPIVEPHPSGIDLEMIDTIGMAFLQTNCVLPLLSETGDHTLVVPDPFDQTAISSVRFLIEQTVSFAVAPRTQILKLLNEVQAADSLPADATIEESENSVSNEDMDRLQDIASEAPVVRFVNQLIQTAVDKRATDIHLEPLQDKLVTRCRIDGILHHIADVAKAMQPGITTRIKVLCRMNIAERRRPQDGRMRAVVRGKNVDLRVSTLPTINGESVVLRILDKSSAPLDLPSLGFDNKACAQLHQLAQAPNGIVLATGPTGSGKTTTLYALLQKIMRPEIKVFTIEDPVEYKLDNAIQLQVNADIDFTFANALRSVLRQDPDVILVGEIRDRETAEIAIRASLTGHLVFSTLHTNSATEAITRLRDMGVESFLLAATIRGIIAQRLLRKTCKSCGGVPAKSRSCATCEGARYYGRSVTYEILPVSQTLSAAISSEQPSSTILKSALKEGMASLHDHAKSLVSSNVTNLEEVRRVMDLPDA